MSFGTNEQGMTPRSDEELEAYLAERERERERERRKDRTSGIVAVVLLLAVVVGGVLWALL